jgi:phage gp29-like protein
MGKLKDKYLSVDTPPDTYDQYYDDISIVFENNEAAQILLHMMCQQSLQAVEERDLPASVAVSVIAHKIRDLYDDAIDYVSRETAENTLGNMLVQQMCTNMPLSVFERIARDLLADYRK